MYFRLAHDAGMPLYLFVCVRTLSEVRSLHMYGEALGLFVGTIAEAVFSCPTEVNYTCLPEWPAYPSESNTRLQKQEAGCQHNNGICLPIQ
jgi:hypothetical protein